jgi:spore germination protein
MPPTREQTGGGRLRLIGTMLLCAASTMFAAAGYAAARSSAAAPHPAAAAAAAAAPKFQILGFQSDSDAPGLIDQNARAMTIVGVDGINLTGPGRVSAPTSADAAERDRAHADGLAAQLLVGNWSARVNDFSEQLAHQTLGSGDSTTQAAVSVADDVERGGWNGVSVDLESLAPRDMDGLSRFVDILRARLPANDPVTVCLEAFTTPGSYRANGYDLRALASSATQIVLMTYDDHGPWEDTPGPIGPLAWQRASIRALESALPAQQIFLGAANYGYAWRPHSNENLSVTRARELALRWHAHPHWSASAGEWTARLRDGSTLWWSDARSVALRFKLAHALGVHGVAVWSLGSGDPLPDGR